MDAPPLLMFLVYLAAITVAGWWRGWPLHLALVEAAGFATALTLVVHGEDLAWPYGLKATLIAAGAIVSTHVIVRDPIRRRSPPDRPTTN